MPYPLKPILSQLAVLTQTDTYDYLTFEYLWQWVVFHNDNTELNDTMDIHDPSGIAVGERSYDFRDDLKIKGDFLLFEMIDHAPAYELRTYDSKIAMLDRMVAIFFNGFASLTVPIIQGEVLGVIEIYNVRQKYFGDDVDWDFDSYKVEESLMMEIHDILKVYLEDNNFQQLIEDGQKIIQKYSDRGISSQTAYDVITHLNMMYELFGFDLKIFFNHKLGGI